MKSQRNCKLKQKRGFHSTIKLYLLIYLFSFRVKNLLEEKGYHLLKPRKAGELDILTVGNRLSEIQKDVKEIPKLNLRNKSSAIHLFFDPNYKIYLKGFCVMRKNEYDLETEEENERL
jgi:hypothetical protein